MDVLGTSPTRHLVRLPKPTDRLVLEFSAPDPADPSRDFLVSLSVVYRADEETILVFNCDLLILDAEPPSPDP